MTQLDPEKLFARLAAEIPKSLHPNFFVTGSLAAAYHFRDLLAGRAVNTKDADIVIHPAGNTLTARMTAEHLLSCGWRRKTGADGCFPRPNPEPADELRAIRLFPPKSSDYFIELLNVPAADQIAPKIWVPVELPDGWYGLPSFRSMGLTACSRMRSDVGIEYASPAMMALANLLAHRELGTARISAPIQGRILRRSSKDLGRVLSLAWLAGRDETEQWLDLWKAALKATFPKTWPAETRNAGDGLRQLLKDQSALEEARITTDIGLLSGKSVTAENLRATAERLLLDVIEPFEQLGR